MPELSKLTGTNNLTTDDGFELCLNPRYDSDNSNPRLSPHLHRDRLPRSNHEHDLNILPPLERLPAPGSSCNSQQNEAPCGAESITEERSTTINSNHNKAK